MGCDHSTTKERAEEPLSASRGWDKNMPPPSSTLVSSTAPSVLGHWGEYPDERDGAGERKGGGLPSRATSASSPLFHNGDRQASVDNPRRLDTFYNTASPKLSRGGASPYPFPPQNSSNPDEVGKSIFYMGGAGGSSGGGGGGGVWNNSSCNNRERWNSRDDNRLQPPLMVLNGGGGGTSPPGRGEGRSSSEHHIMVPFTKRVSTPELRSVGRGWRESGGFGDGGEGPKPTFPDEVDDYGGTLGRGGGGGAGGGGNAAAAAASPSGTPPTADGAAPLRFSNSFHALIPPPPGRNSQRSFLNSNVLHDSTVSPRRPLRRSSTMMSQGQSIVKDWLSIFRGPGFLPHQFSPELVYRCFAEGNGLLFRLVDDSHHQWAYYNDTRKYNMDISVTFGHESAVFPLGEGVQKTLLNPESGSCRLEATVGPGELLLFMRGEYNGFKTLYEANPITEML